MVESLRRQIGILRDDGLSIILAEQNLDFVLSLATRVYIMEKGEVRFTGAPAEVRGDAVLMHRYLTV